MNHRMSLADADPILWTDEQTRLDCLSATFALLAFVRGQISTDPSIPLDLLSNHVRFFLTSDHDEDKTMILTVCFSLSLVSRRRFNASSSSSPSPHPSHASLSTVSIQPVSNLYRWFDLWRWRWFSLFQYFCFTRMSNSILRNFQLWHGCQFGTTLFECFNWLYWLFYWCVDRCGERCLGLHTPIGNIVLDRYALFFNTCRPLRRWNIETRLDLGRCSLGFICHIRRSGLWSQMLSSSGTRIHWEKENWRCCDQLSFVNKKRIPVFWINGVVEKNLRCSF